MLSRRPRPPPKLDVQFSRIRLIERDDESVLAWAREPWVCTVMNLHVDHTPDRIAKAADDFRRLIDRAIEFGGSYFLTYHRWASRSQVETCHPRMVEFLRAKRRHDPAEAFQSDWYRPHHRQGAGPDCAADAAGERRRGDRMRRREFLSLFGGVAAAWSLCSTCVQQRSPGRRCPLQQVT